MENSLILSQARAEAVYTAMTTFNRIGGRMARMALAFSTGGGPATVSFEEFSDGVIFLSWCDHQQRPHHESYANQAAFATAYGLVTRAVEHDEPDDAEREAVANANAHLNNAGLPTIRELVRAVSGGPSPVIGFDPNGQRQSDFSFGWKTAMEYVWKAMRGTVATQRSIDNAEG